VTEGLNRSGGYAAACRLLGIDPGVAPAKSASSGRSAEARRLVRAAKEHASALKSESSGDVSASGGGLGAWYWKP
jgi:hypothetical protein